MERFSIVVLYLVGYNLIGIAESQAATPTCTEQGFFEIVDGTCKNYYICVDNGEMLVPVSLSCASTAIFDPEMGRCVPESSATCLQTTTTPPTTLAPSCGRYGRFRIPDVNCKKYYLCYWNGTDYRMMGNLTCPNALVFEPTSEKCVSPMTYKCLGTG